MLEKSSEAAEMSSVAEASALVRRVADPGDMAEGIKVAIGRAARRLGLSYSRTKHIWYGSARRIDAYEMDRLRAEAERCNRERAIANVVALREHLAADDPEFYGAAVSALDGALRALGTEIRAVAIRQETA